MQLAFTPMVLPITKNEVHVWLAFPSEILDPSLLQNYRELMNAQEKAREQSFRFARHRHQYLVSRALVRSTLSKYEQRAPEKWNFTFNKYGRPGIAPGQNTSALQFNLSKTNGLIACAVTIEKDLGVDVETIDPEVNTVSIADRYFSPFEVQSLMRLSGSTQERFFQYWTLKESYIKAKGMGLAIPLERFSFHLDEDGPVRVSFDPDFPDDPGDWQFALFRPTINQFLALSIRRGHEKDLEIQGFQTIPLADSQHSIEPVCLNFRDWII